MGFAEKVKKGACTGCGSFVHEDLAKMSDSELNDEIKRLENQQPLESIDEFGDQQGNIGRLLCIAHEQKRRKMEAVPEIVKCTSVFSLRSVHTGKGVCIGYTEETPPGRPEGDVIHFCWLSKEGIKKHDEGRCFPLYRISCTVGEAERIGMKFIVAADLQLQVVARKRRKVSGSNAE